MNTHKKLVKKFFEAFSEQEYISSLENEDKYFTGKIT